MFIVPLTGDTVETPGGVTHVVLSYSAYKDKPAVYVEGEGASTESVPLADIKSINGTPVQQTGGKVFTASSKIKRKLQLPQTDDKVTIDGDVTKQLKVKSLKLFERGNLASGMIVVGEDVESKEPSTARLAEVIKIERANGEDSFSRRAFMSLYKDYLGSIQ
jgi:hypothetical protein